jgi:hypothetical protein
MARLMRKSAIASAMVAALGSSAICDNLSAANLTFSFTGSTNGGLFTMLDPGGTGLQNTSYPYYGDPTWGYGFRTQITGTFTIDTATNSGSMNINPFQFFNGNPTLPATAKNITFTDASSDPAAGGADLLLANMQFDWNGNNNIPVSLVWNVNGLMSAIGTGLNVGDVVSGGSGCGTCATPASSGIKKNSLPIGPTPIATTSFDPTHTGGTNSSRPVANRGDDGIGGSPMQAGPLSTSMRTSTSLRLQSMMAAARPSPSRQTSTSLHRSSPPRPASTSTSAGHRRDGWRNDGIQHRWQAGC